MPANGRLGARLALALALLAAGAGRPSLAEECARYDPATTRLEGELQLRVLPGPPHYKSFETGDQPESVWLLVLERPLCIEAEANDADNAAISGVSVVEVLARAPIPVQLNGKAVTVEGALYRPRGGHPHALVAMRAAKALARP